MDNSAFAPSTPRPQMTSMKPIEETFLELDWDSEAEARQARDARAEELKAQGMVCVLENLYNPVNGRRVFTLTATEAEPIGPTTLPDSPRDSLRAEGTKNRSGVPKRRVRLDAEPEIR